MRVKVIMYNHTWLVQTLLKVTNANVCASMAAGRSFLARTKGMSTHERASWGKKATDSMRGKDEERMAGKAEAR
jgi:hypothetical protein